MAIVNDFENSKHPRNRDAGKPGHPTRFAAVPNPEGAADLTIPHKLSIPVQFDADIDAGNRVNELPDWPASLPEPTVSFGHDGGTFEGYFSLPDGTSWKMWEGPEGDTQADCYSWDFKRTIGHDWDDEDFDAVVEWSEAVFQRMDSNVYGLTLRASGSLEISAAIIAAATNKPFTPLTAPIYTPEEIAESKVKESIARAGTRLEAWFGTSTGDRADADETTLQDALTDMSHWADAMGIDIREVFEHARGNFVAEQEEEA